MSASDTLTSAVLAKCPTLKGKDNYAEWEEIMRSNLRTSGCWDIVSGEEVPPPRPNPFYTSRNRPAGVKSLRQTEAEYGQRNRAGHFTHSEESCQERVQEIKDQVAGYESYTRLKEKAKNLMMDSMTKELWHQRVNKEDPSALWQELRDDYHKAGVPELGKELAKYADMNRSTYPNPQTLLNALKTQHSKIEVTLKATVFHPKYLSWRYIHEMNKFKPLFDIPLAQYDTLDEYPPAEEIKRALEAHLVNHSDIPKKPTVGKTLPSLSTASINVNVAAKNRKRKREEEKPANQRNSSSEKPQCPHCDINHYGDCWVKFPEKMPQEYRKKLAKKRKNLDAQSNPLPNSSSIMPSIVHSTKRLTEGEEPEVEVEQGGDRALSSGGAGLIKAELKLSRWVKVLM
jgi:hypothetical protein